MNAGKFRRSRTQRNNRRGAEARRKQLTDKIMEKEKAQTKVQPPKSEKPKVEKPKAEKPKAEKPKVQIPTIGRIVHAVVQIHEGNHAELVIRPAIIVRIWPTAKKGVVATSVQAQVFMDGDGGPSN